MQLWNWHVNALRRRAILDGFSSMICTASVIFSLRSMKAAAAPSRAPALPPRPLCALHMDAAVLRGRARPLERRAQCSGACRSKEGGREGGGKAKAKEKAKAAIGRREDVEREQQQPSSACCLADVSTADTIPEDGHYSGRSRCVLGGQRGWSTTWQVNDATFQSQQNTVENYGKKLKTPAGRWLRWRLHDVRSKVLYCLGREGQPCHDGGIVRAFAEAKSEEEQA